MAESKRAGEQAGFDGASDIINDIRFTSSPFDFTLELLTAVVKTSAMIKHFFLLNIYLDKSVDLLPSLGTCILIAEEKRLLLLLPRTLSIAA